MKLFQWIVLIRCNSGSFYGCVASGRFLTGIKHVPDLGYKPLFGDADPVLYPRRSARFQAQELRRVGYNVRTVPYVLVMVVAWIKARKNKSWKH